MATKRRGGLGRGLDKLIPNKSAFSDSAKNKVSPDNGVKTTNTEMAPEDSSIRNESQNNDSEMAISEPIQEIMEEKSESGNQLGSDMISSDKSTDSNDSYSETEDEIASSTEDVDVYDSSLESNDKGDSVLIMKISSVEPNRDQPRKHFSEEGIEELASSIKQYGIIQPLLVQKREDYYEIIAGERRWRAAMKAGLKEVPVIVKDYSNREAVEISLIENIQREDLNPIEEALAYDRLIQEFELTQEQVAGRVSKSRSAVTNSLRLLKLADDVRQMVIAGDISEGHARTLLGLPNEEMQRLLAERIVKEKLSVRETEKLVKKLTSNTPKKTKARDYQKEAILGNLSEQLKVILGTKVSITEKGKSKGKIEIEYYSDDELNRIFEMLQSLNKY
jgi:ParB family chromosome partitioning protein